MRIITKVVSHRIESSRLAATDHKAPLPSSGQAEPEEILYFATLPGREAAGNREGWQEESRGQSAELSLRWKQLGNQLPLFSFKKLVFSFEQ